jgi:hypothetical protein
MMAAVKNWPKSTETEEKEYKNGTRTRKGYGNRYNTYLKRENKK